MKDPKIDFTNSIDLRKKAEEKLAIKQRNNGEALDLDVQRLLHELQVHQIELEMQNEELIDAYNNAETALKKYTILYDFAPASYFTLNSDGYISELNFTAAEMLGQRRINLLNRNFRIFVADDMKATFNSFFNNAFKSQSKEICEVVLIDDNENRCLVRIEGFVIVEDNNCLLSVFDISGYHK